MRALRNLLFRATTTVVCVFAVLLGHGQRDESLARDFEKMSAKERAKVAKEEQEGAAKDVAYQAVMAEAEKLFQQQAYEASMEKFKEARNMRPYNVYPKVKIQDLEALIARRDATKAAAEPTPVVEEPIATPIPLPVKAVDPVGEEEPVKVEEPPVESSKPVAKEVPAAGRLVLGSPERPVVERVREEPVQQRTSPPVRTVVEEKPVPRMERRVIPQEPGPVLEEGERIYKEGRSVVLERRLAVEGRIVVFRKVSHPWGEVHHFRDGIAITDREFEEAGR